MHLLVREVSPWQFLTDPLNTKPAQCDSVRVIRLNFRLQYSKGPLHCALTVIRTKIIVN